MTSLVRATALAAAVLLLLGSSMQAQEDSRPVLGPFGVAAEPALADPFEPTNHEMPAEDARPLQGPVLFDPAVVALDDPSPLALAFAGDDPAADDKVSVATALQIANQTPELQTAARRFYFRSHRGFGRYYRRPSFRFTSYRYGFRRSFSPRFRYYTHFHRPRYFRSYRPYYGFRTYAFRRPFYGYRSYYGYRHGFGFRSFPSVSVRVGFYRPYGYYGCYY